MYRRVWVCIEWTQIKRFDHLMWPMFRYYFCWVLVIEVFYFWTIWHAFNLMFARFSPWHFFFFVQLLSFNLKYKFGMENVRSKKICAFLFLEFAGFSIWPSFIDANQNRQLLIEKHEMGQRNKANFSGSISWASGMYKVDLSHKCTRALSH